MAELFHEQPGHSNHEVRSPALYTVQKYLKDLCTLAEYPGASLDDTRAFFNVEGLPVTVNVVSLVNSPLTDGSPDDVLRVCVSARLLEALLRDGYTDTINKALGLAPEVIEHLKLQEGLSRLRQEAGKHVQLPSSERFLEYTVTREELPGTVPIICAFLNAKAYAHGLRAKITREDLLYLSRGGLAASGLANLIDGFPLEEQSSPVIELAKRPEPDEVSKIEVPLSEEHRAMLKRDNPDYPVLKALGLTDRIALAVVLKDEEDSADFRLAAQAICHGLSVYYHSPQSSQNRREFERHWTRVALKEQKRLRECLDAQGGYSLEKHVTIPRPQGPATFELPIRKELDVPDLIGCRIQNHYLYSSKAITDPETNEYGDVPWIVTQKEFLVGARVDEEMVEAVRSGYTVVTRPMLEDPLGKRFCNLYDLLQHDMWARERRPGPVDAFVCVVPGPQDYGRIFSITFTDEAAEFGKPSPAVSEMRARLQAAFEELPKEVKEVVSKHRKSGIDIFDDGTSGSMVACEKYPRMMEILFDYLRSRAAEEWQKASSDPKSNEIEAA